MFNAAAARRCAAAERLRLLRGTTQLATIAATAPLLGLMLTATGIASMFAGGVSGDPRGVWLWTIGALGQNLAPAALSLAIAIHAWCCHRYAAARTEAFAVEMEAAILHLSNRLRRP